ncbi:outer envelope pore protein 37, chloroplastic isoform X2 [Oryza sativa Japonica Group]|uniref:Os12g0225200 protein n=2 Tax=Oryza sativa subsp. japonica TaxID=39947 RepID=Q0IPC0_ORYSJ|nr:outer envelope pore protein 37, chloroplastic isoform X2 [Oryza sativa Japonica Group]ABA96799.1 outer envelope protein, putative, expressed [Oryza sativa Japonica Group]BAF29445.1 Os12g0225200 [Oryza sativa Japonica Group]|eukprot:NP_001066426.1 Os12g0225200 [Oryza sativa Japonica Group]
MAAPALLSAPPPPPPMDEDASAGAHHAFPGPAPPPSPEGAPPPPRRRRSAVRVTSEFDSDARLFSHRLSCRVMDGLAKLRVRVHHGVGGAGAAAVEPPPPEVALLARNFSVAVDTVARSAMLRGAADLAGSLRLSAKHDTKEQKGEVAVRANLGDSPCKIELSSVVPPDGLPRTTFIFPNGEVSVKQKYLDEGDRILSVNGIVRSHVLNGVCTALYSDNEMNIKYRYKDEELSFIPSLSLPSNSLSFAFKRQFTPSDKLSYRYQFDTNYWSFIYKHKASKHVKWKAGYESDQRLGWASLWVGDAGGKTKEVPMKAKVQLTLKVPQDNVKNSAIMFNVKKRWDF